MTSESSLSDHYQFEGGGRDDQTVIADAQQMLTTLYELRNPQAMDKFDFSDPQTGDLPPYLGADTPGQKLAQVQELILRLKEYKQRTKDQPSMVDMEADMVDEKPAAEEAIDNSVAAGDEFLIWEPRNCCETIWSVLQNMMEVYLWLITACVAYEHPSMNSAIFMLLTTMLFHSMTKDVKDRFKWNILFIIIINVYLVVVFIAKLVMQSKNFAEGKTFEKEEYANIVSDLLLLGFSFKYNTDLFDNRDALQCPCELTEFSFIKSYDIEITVLVTSLLLLWYSIHKHFQIQSQMKVVRQDYIDYIQLINTTDDDSEEEEAFEDDLKDGYLILPASVKRQQIEQKKEEKKREQKDKLNELKKIIRRNMVGSEAFYNHNQFYFVMGIIATLFEAVSFNTISSIPGLFMIIGLLSLFEIRKNFSRAYRTFSFFTLYWVQIIMITKIAIELIVKVESVNARLHNLPDTDIKKQMIQILFGELHSLESIRQTEITYTSYYWILTTLFCIYCAQAWKACKWLEIRDKTSDMQYVHSSMIRFWKYIQVRQLEDRDELRLVDIHKSSDSKKTKKLMEKKVKQDLSKRQNKRYDAGKTIMKARNQNSNLSSIIFMLAQVNMFILSYMYHSSAGLMTLTWLIASFYLSANTTLFMSIVFMIPVLTWEFVLIYLSRVPKIKNTTFFVEYGKYFRFKMNQTTFEQFFMLITLLLFYMMISIYVKRRDMKNVENRVIGFFRVRIQNRKIGWIWVFYSCRWAHILILVTLLGLGVQNLNCINNLGYLAFFVIYTAYESAYRQTCRVLILFSSLFILGQYIYSLHYQIYMRADNDEQIFNLYWWNMFPSANKAHSNPMQDPFHIPREPSSLYFRISPPWDEWATVAMMKLLIELNIMYTTEKAEEYKLRMAANNVMAESTGKAGYYFKRTLRIMQGLFIYLLIIGVVGVQAFVEPSIIAWGFFGLNLINLSYMIKGGNRRRDIRIQYYLSQTIKIYSLTVIIISMIVLANSHTIDHDEEWHGVKQWLQIFGFKANAIDYQSKEFDHLSEEAKKHKISSIENTKLAHRMIAMVIFFLTSMYLVNHFNSKLQHAKEDENFNEEDYKKLFEYKLKSKNQSAGQQTSSSSEEDDDLIVEDGMQESIYKKRRSYTQKDLIDFYEGVRFTLPFMTYRAMRWWNFMDVFSKYANLFITSIYIYACLYMSVSLLNCINLFVLVTYFATVTVKVGKKAENIQKMTSVGSQCDVQMARLVTRNYKKETFYEFLAARRSTWSIMFAVFITAALLGYPTTLLNNIKKMNLSINQREQVNEAILFLFYSGLNIDDQNITMFYMLILGLAVERIAINWQENRFGCTHFKLQKFIELDMRREAIRADWDIPNPVYDIERYRRHYFRTDFNDLKKLMQNQTYQQMLNVQKMQEQMLQGLGDQLSEKAMQLQKDQYAKQTYGDYVPLKVAMRIHHTVEFSVKLDCRAKDLGLDDQQKKLVQQEDIDYETVPVLKRHKISALLEILKEAVDRKYKISLYKGLQLWIESLCIFFLIISLILKANFWSIIYLIFVFKFTMTRNKTNLLVRQCSYLSVSLFLQYVLYWLNMTSQSSIQPFPKVGDDENSLANYPIGFMDDQNQNVPKYILPLFFHSGFFRDHMSLSYMLGVGIDKQQVWSLTFDFINIFLITMMIFEFRNPILNKSLKKVFWQFPTKDNTEQWARLEPDVQKQVDWIYSPKPLYRDNVVHPQFAQVEKELSKDQIKLANSQYKFAQEYNKHNNIDLNYHLTNYVDIKYTTIWGEEFMKEKKWEIKKNCVYFRVVKQGSQLVYISFHIFTILLVLVMAAMRQSLFAVVYVLILLPRMKDGSDVLKQRDIQQGKEIEDLENEIEDIKDKLKQTSVKQKIVDILKSKMGLIGDVIFEETQKHWNKYLDRCLKMNVNEIDDLERQLMVSRQMDISEFNYHTQSLLNAPEVLNDEIDLLVLLLVKKYRKISGDQISELIQQEMELSKKKYKLEKQFQKKNAQLKKTDRDSLAKQQWSMIKVMQQYLLIYALIDTTIQILFQMPAVMPGNKNLDSLRKFGFRKIWAFDPGHQTYNGKKPNDLGDMTYGHFIECRRFQDNGKFVVDQSGNPIHGNCPHFVLDWKAFYFQYMNCFIIATIILQSEIFSSAGYLKYVTQHGGSMDLLMELSELKAKSITYVINNYKIRKILNIQRKREQTLATVEKLKEKIFRWRQFTRTTLTNERGPSTFVASGAIENPDNKKELELKNQSKSDKNVKFAAPEQNEEDKSDQSEEEDDAFVKEHLTREKLRIAPEDREYLLKKLAYDFVQSKMSKQRMCVKFYLWLQNTFVEKIMFKNQKLELEYIKQRLAEGSVAVPTELEALMTTEAEELINQHYDNLEGNRDLAMLMKINRDKSQSLLDLTKFDKKIKLNQLKMSWDFTRSLPMMLHLIETFFYMLISQSQSIIYFSMIFSMYMNAGFISLPYPIAVFGWALLEERRPGKNFWIFIRYYTEVILGFKFILNLDFFSFILQSEGFVTYSAYLKLGIYDFDDLSRLIMYMLPEVMILCFLMLHEIKLQLIGLHDRSEEDVEPVLDAIERNLQKGDEEAVKARKVELQNMCMSRYFESALDQNIRKDEFMNLEMKRIEEEVSKMSAQDIKHNEDYQHIIHGHYSTSQLKSPEVIQKLVQHDYNQKYPTDIALKEQQYSLFKEISNSIIKTSSKYDLDSKGKKSSTDDLVKGSVIQKTLETDNLIFVEGMRPNVQPKFMTPQQFKDEKTEQANWDVISTGDTMEEMKEKYDSIQDRKMYKPGVFERKEYFDRIFPSLKVQKPGYDLYGTTTTILAIIGGYIFIFFDSYSFSQAKFDYHKGQSVLFLFEMAIMVLFIITIIIIERYANRSDTKKIEEKAFKTEDDSAKKKSFFSNEEMFKRTTTQRSMTVKIKTVKTSDLDLNSSAAQDFLNDMGGDGDDNDIEDSRTKITSQQKTKFIIHWIILIFSHVYCFWLIPIKANYELYGSAACNEEQKQYYGCYQFKENPYIRVLYILFVLYLIVSSFQLSYGFPILKKASSVFQYYNDLGMIIAQVYNAIPFVIEIRCLLDFTFSKTTLDVFQFWQLFYYHFELYIGWTGNRFYTIKTLGSPTECLDKFIFGVLIGSVLLFLLIGPFYIFSTASPLVNYNPVIQGKFELNLQVNTSVCYNPTTGDVKVDCFKVRKDPDYLKIPSSLPYRLYFNEDPYLEDFSAEMWKDNDYSKKTETRDFKPEQVQYAILRRHSDSKMSMSPSSKAAMSQKIIQETRFQGEVGLSLQQYYRFERQQPPSALESYYKNNRTINYQYVTDCITLLELREFAEHDCGNIKDRSLSSTVIWTQILNPALVLGQSNFAVEVKEKQIPDADLLHDMKMTYFCDNTWDIRMTHRPTVYPKAKDPTVPSKSPRWVMKEWEKEDDNNNILQELTCKLNNTQEPIDDVHMDEFNKINEDRKAAGYYDIDLREYYAILREEGKWSAITFTLFGMQVATGFLSSFTPMTFYAVLVYGLSATVRLAFVFSTWQGFTYEVTRPEALMKLFECCYMMRHEENLIAEEECYRMIQEIIRQPDLYKQLTGTSLAGSMHPDLDHLNKQQRKKLDQLDKLERKGWDVSSLKQKIITGDRKIDDDF